MNDLDYIKTFSKITITNACKKVGVKSNNLWAGKVKAEKIHMIRRIIESDVAELYKLKVGEIDGKKSDTL